MGRKPKAGTMFSLKLEDELRRRLENARPKGMSIARFLEWSAWYFAGRGKVPPEPKR